MSNNIDIKIKAKTEGIAEIEKLKNQLSDLGKIESFKKLKKDIQSTEEAWQSAQEKVSALAKELAQAEGPTKNLSTQFNAAKKEAGELKDRFISQQKALHELRNTLQESEINTKNLNSEQKKLASSIEKTREEIREASQIEIAKGIFNVKTYKEVNKEIEDLEKAYESLEKSGVLNANELSKAYKTLKQKTSDLRDETNKYGDALSSTSKISKGFIAALAVAAIAAIGAAFVKVSEALFETGTQLQALNLAYKTIFETSQRAHEEFEFLRQTANDLGLEFYSTAEAYKALAAAANGTALKGDGVRKVFVGISEASTALGLSAESAEGVLRSVSQMMGKGKVSAEELRQQMGEHLPGAFNLAAESMGLTTQEFDKLMSEGQIFTEDFLPRFADVLHEKFSKASEDAAGTAQASFNQFKTAWTDLKNEMADSGFLEGVSNAFKNLTSELSKPETIAMAKQLGEAMGTVIEWSAQGVGKFTEFALASSQFSEGIKLVNEGLIDYKEFVGSDFTERQSLIDEALKKSGTVTEEFAQTLETKLKQKLKDVSEETGVTSKSMDDLEAAVASGAIVFDEASGTWVGAEKKKQDAIKETLNAARDAATQISVTQTEMIGLIEQSSTAMIDKIKESAEQGKLTESEAAKQIVAINQEKYEQILSFAEEKLANVKELYGEDSQAYKTTSAEVEEIAKELKEYKIKAIKDVTSALKSELSQQLAEEKQLNNELTSLRDKLVSDQESRADDIRAIRQGSMTDAEKQADLESQAYEKITKANDALKQGNYERAEDYAKQAKSIAKGLEDEDEAVRLVEESWNVISTSTKEQETEKRAELDKTISKIKELTAEIQKIESSKEIEIKAETDQAQAKLDAVRETLDGIQSKTITVTTIQKTVSKSSSSGSDGGEGYARGGNLPGYGGGDVIPAMLEPGEWVIRKEAVKKYGNTFLARLNAGLLGFKAGGIIPSLAGVKGYSTGGSVSADAYPEDIQSLIEKFYEFLNENVKSMSVTTKNISSFWRYRGLRSYDYNDWFTDGSERPDMDEAEDLISAYQAAASKASGGPGVLSKKLTAFLEKLQNAGLNIGNSDAWPKFQFGGLVDSMSKPNFSIPNIPSIPNIAGIGGIGGDTARTVNHSVTLNINGNTVGPLSGDQATIGDFISQLKKAQRVT